MKKCKDCICVACPLKSNCTSCNGCDCTDPTAECDLRILFDSTDAETQEVLKNAEGIYIGYGGDKSE